MDFLIGILSLGLLIAVLVKMGALSGEIEKLKQKVRELEAKTSESKPAAAPAAHKATAAPVAVTKVDEPLVVETPNVHSSQLAKEAVARPVVPPPLPKPERKSFDLLNFLRGIGLWPPVQKEGSAELVLMQWWMPRIGGGLAILTLVFFAVYVAQGTPPWVKFLEMFAASVGVFGLGLFLSKKRPGLGNVLVATGLSMIYISSVAGYAVGPVKVTDNPFYGAGMQIAALLLNFGLGTWRKDRSILVLALIFGYGSSLFAALEGFREAALISSLLVYVAGIISYRRIGGLALVSLSLAGVYLPLAGFIGIKYLKAAPVFPEFWSVIVFIGITVSILPASKRLLKDPGFLETRWNRLYQSLNTSLALGLGFLFVNEFYPLGKTEFYGVLALLFIVWAMIWALRDLEGIEFHLFCIKGSALASLWVINYLGGDYRWMALGIQVLVLTASVHRSKSPWLEVVAGITWIGSYFYFVSSGLNDPTGSFLWCLQLVYIWLSVSGLSFLMAYTPSKQALRRGLYVFPAFALGAVAIVFAANSRVSGIDESGMVAAMGFLLLLVALIPGLRAWVSIVAGAMVFVVSHLMFWIEPSGVYTVSLILLVSIVCLVGLLKASISQWRLVETVVHILWVVTVMFYVDALAGQSWYPVLVALFSIGLFCGGYLPFKQLSDVCALPLLFLVVHEPSADPNGLLLMAFVALVGVLANFGVCLPRYRSCSYFLKRGQLLLWVLNGLFLYWAGWTLARTVGLTEELLIWLALGGGFYALWYWRSLWVSFVAAIVCAVIPVYHIVDLWLNPLHGGLLDGAPWAWQVLLAGLCAMALWLVIGGSSRIKKHDKLSPQGEMLLAWTSAVLAYLAYVAAFDYPLLSWERLYTPCLAAFSIGLIILGIVLKSKPYRLFAMLTFLVPLFRLFVYDIRETLFRIIAFAVLAVLVTIVGFLYQKYSSRIE